MHTGHVSTQSVGRSAAHHSLNAHASLFWAHIPRFGSVVQRWWYVNKSTDISISIRTQCIHAHARGKSATIANGVRTTARARLLVQAYEWTLYVSIDYGPLIVLPIHSDIVSGMPANYAYQECIIALLHSGSVDRINIRYVFTSAWYRHSRVCRLGKRNEYLTSAQSTQSTLRQTPFNPNLCDRIMAIWDQQYYIYTFTTVDANCIDRMCDPQTVGGLCKLPNISTLMVSHKYVICGPTNSPQICAADVPSQSIVTHVRRMGFLWRCTTCLRRHENLGTSVGTHITIYAKYWLQCWKMY